MKLPNTIFAPVLVGAWVLAATGPAVAVQPALVLPINCNPGQTCWIVNYVDHDPGKGVLDYNCGNATYNAPPGNRHKGTDIAIRDLAAMRRGVNVMAAAAGTVLGIRDGMADIDVKKAGGAGTVRGKECGNGVVIAHADGWTTQYCHMRKGSIRVKKGGKVAAGQVIGMVGYSGLSQYPHLHFQVKKGKKIIDPFVGPKTKGICGPGENPLWKKDVMARLPYHPTAIYNLGFTANVPKNAERARQGLLAAPSLPAGAGAMILWADIFQIRKDDKLLLDIDGPGGKKILRYKTVIKKNRARHFIYAGKPLKTSQWPPGDYRGKVTLIRANRGGRAEKITQVRTISISGISPPKKKSEAVPEQAINAAPVTPDTTSAIADTTANYDETLVSVASYESRIWKPKENKWRWLWLAIAIGGVVFIIIYNANEEKKQATKSAKASESVGDENNTSDA